MSRWEAIGHSRSAESGWCTTLRLHPLTGRNHQLRRHLAFELGTPILGDPKYLTDTSRASRSDELYLWASGIELPHPASGERVRVESEAAF